MDARKPDIYEFDDFRLDASERTLTRCGKNIALTPRVFETLLYLVRHRGRVLPKDELMQEIWPDATVEENNLNQNISTLRRFFGETRGEDRFIVTVPGRGYRFVASVKVSTAQATAESPSRTIAVLPFVNMSADAENEYFCDGLAEELLNALSKVDGMRVAARTSSFAFKGKDTPIMDIGRTLAVSAILEGSVRRSDNHVRINVQLINVADGYHLWSERYDREMRDIFEVQDQITLAVMDALKVRILGGPKVALLKRHTENTEAYHLYLKGRYFWFKSAPREFSKSLEYFERSLELDPHYALGYFGLASYYGFASSWGLIPPDEGWLKMEEATTKALALDDALAEVHHGLAALRWVYYRDWPAADKAFQRALELNPEIGPIHSHYSVYLRVVGRFDDAIAEGNQALQLDPLSARMHRNQAANFYHARKYDDALEQYSEALDLDPNDAGAREELANVYAQMGCQKEAIAEWQTAMTLASDEDFRAVLCTAYSKKGFDAAVGAVARKRLERLKERRAQGQYVPVAYFASASVRLGDKDQVFHYLDAAADERNALSLLINTDPLYDSMRADPRFHRFIKRINLK